MTSSDFSCKSELLRSSHGQDQLRRTSLNGKLTLPLSYDSSVACAESQVPVLPCSLDPEFLSNFRIRFPLRHPPIVVVSHPLLTDERNFHVRETQRPFQHSILGLHNSRLSAAVMKIFLRTATDCYFKCRSLPLSDGLR